jgi:AAHS family 4-hydroxybenzoate transporter-like MFS transporter
MNVISFVMPYLEKGYQLDPVMKGNVFSSGLVGTMIGGFLFGWIGDIWGRRPAIILSTALFGLLTLGLATADSYQAFLGWRLVLGIATGGMLPLAWALNIEFAAKPYRATIVTLVMIGYSAGIAVGGPISNWLIPLYGWRSVFILGGVLSLLSAGVLIAMLPESVRFLASKGADPSRIATILRRVAPRELILDSARFILTDEATAHANFRVPMLFDGLLRYMTPLLWVAYIFSSITAFFLATWTPLVFEALHFTRADAALAGSINAAMGAIGASC